MVRGAVGLVACIICAMCTTNVSARYNPYSYFFNRPGGSADAYSSMGDIDWKKRSFDTGEEDPFGNAMFLQPKRTYTYQSYKYRQPYMKPKTVHRRSYPEYPQAYARYGAISRPQTRVDGERQTAYTSMADMDWGWRKRSQLPTWLDYAEDLEQEEPAAIDDEEMEQKVKKNVAALAKSNLYPKNHKLYPGKRFDNEFEAEDDHGQDFMYDLDKRNIGSIVRSQRSGMSPFARNGELRASAVDDVIEDKRNLGSIVRSGRSGISSLARNGGLRP
jgi:hypothetical protein